jgi:ABC-type lipoprotein export system ATPase subunit
MIRLSNIWKSYQDGEGRLNHVLREVSMEVEKGAFVAVKGPSGSGKTTLLSILGTMLQPDEGSYLLDGTEMTTPSADYAYVRNKKIGFVFQDHRLMPQYSALENILLPTLACRQEASRKEIEYAHHLLELTHITHVANQYPSQLSGGEAGRVAICRSLIMKPLLVLADEPTGQLDADNARNIAALLSEINKNLQTTIVLVTHSDDLASIANRVFTFSQGRLT